MVFRGENNILKELCVKQVQIFLASQGMLQQTCLFAKYMKGYCCIFSLFVFWRDWVWASQKLTILDMVKSNEIFNLSIWT